MCIPTTKLAGAGSSETIGAAAGSGGAGAAGGGGGGADDDIDDAVDDTDALDMVDVGRTPRERAIAEKSVRIVHTELHHMHILLLINKIKSVF